ncbi:metal ABC transporter solute-binding protein, Zn/Mn family [Halobacillus salinus]|uniref:Adhesin n=1 Tax=Halobacillus salinus TaxID=192814 RepID=A0A4Z0GXR7_9BACI|nr:zinc ABC transporter substrate-binding protein [Halobacillus salinus]TGB01379.1 adhesin [Halobacillus salinus]
MKHVLKLSLLILSIFIITACSSETSSESSEKNAKDEKVKIFTTVYPLQYFAEQIAGDEAEVTSILPPGSDPHTFEPTTKEMIEIAEADLFIYNGAGLEAYAEKIADSVESEDVRIVEASQGIDLKEHVHEGEASREEEHAHEEEGSHEDEHAHEEDAHDEGSTHEEEGHEGHNHGDQDPHVWLDPTLAAELAQNVKDQLVEVDPENESLYQQNFEDLEKRLQELDQTFHQEIEDLPKNEIIVSHAAYGYWEQAYGLEQIAVSGLSPTSEPSQQELEQIIEVANEHGLNHVLFEQNVTPKIAEVVRKEMDAEALRIHNLSVLTEEDVQNEEDYFSLMEGNIEVLKTALSDAE